MHLGEELGTRRRPGYSLVVVTWATFGAEAADPRGGGTLPCHGGGRARPSLLGCVGAQVLQYLAGSPGISHGWVSTARADTRRVLGF